MDTTMDVLSYDQCVIVLQYLLGTEVKEKVVGLKCVQSTTGESLFEMFLDILKDVEIAPENSTVFRAAKLFPSVMSRLLDEMIDVNSFLEAENLYLELELPSKRARKLKKKMPGELADGEETARGLPSNAFDKICDMVTNIDKGKFIEELEFFVQDWPQISLSLTEVTEEYNRDADMESDTESETSEENVQN
ncbi:hypothetical protein PR048_013407 [Dryococelus australis]|uniref:Uncharacterized protein n=1 Tax=Dryococelus australis TaxID=614101 RepID=A0ABQ9HS27_9NEOP|nr:hypothetical protein PR048_013407 [Dryococelus australis]